jgi:hypothetical protein
MGVAGQKPGANNSWTITTTGVLNAGELGVIVLALDNTNTSDGDQNIVSSVTDSAGNTWSKAAEHQNGQSGQTLPGGTICSIWYVVATSTLNSGGTISVSFAANLDARAATHWAFTKGASTTISVGGANTVQGDGINLPSLTLSGLTSREYLWIRGSSCETSSDSYVASTNFTAFTVTNAKSTGGASATNQCARGEYRIATATSQTTDPDQGNFDSASILVAFYEAAGGTITPSSVGGGLTPTGALAGEVHTRRTAGLTPTAAERGLVKHSLTAALPPTATVLRKVRDALAAALTPSTTVTARSVVRAVLSAGLTPTRTLVRIVQKPTLAALTPVGALVRRVRDALASALTPSATAAGSFVSGSPGGVIYEASVGAGLTPAATVVRRVRHSLAAALAPSGIVLRRVRAARIAGIAPGSALSRRVRRGLAGAISPIASAAGSFVPGSPGGTIYEAAVGAVLTPVAAITRRGVYAARGASLTPAGFTGAAIQHALGGAIGLAASVARLPRIHRVGAITPTTALTRTLFHRLGAMLTPLGAVFGRLPGRTYIPPATATLVQRPLATATLVKRDATGSALTPRTVNGTVTARPAAESDLTPTPQAVGSIRND